MHNENYKQLEKVLKKMGIQVWIVRNLIEKRNCYVKSAMDNNENLYSDLREIFGGYLDCESPSSGDGYIISTTENGVTLAQDWVYASCGARF